MGFFSICKGDPVIEALREIFKANPLRIPEKRVQPCCVVAKKDKKVSFRGKLGPLLQGDEAFEVPIHSSKMPQLSGKKTKEVGAEMGAKICGDLLKGFGFPGVDLSTAFNNSKDFSFSFQNVERHYIEINELGAALSSREINRDNPAATIFFKSESSLLLIDSIITSSGFDINMNKDASANLDVKVDEIKNLIGETDVKLNIKKNSENSISFEGEDALTFAFTCVEFVLDPATNKITSLEHAPSNVTMEKAAKSKKMVLDEEPSLLSFDD